MLPKQEQLVELRMLGYWYLVTEVEFGWEPPMMPLPQTTTCCCNCYSMNDYSSHVVARMSIKTTVNLLPTARNLDAVLENGPQMMHSNRWERAEDRRLKREWLSMNRETDIDQQISTWNVWACPIRRNPNHFTSRE